MKFFADIFKHKLYPNEEG